MWVGFDCGEDNDGPVHVARNSSPQADGVLLADDTGHTTPPGWSTTLPKISGRTGARIYFLAASVIHLLHRLSQQPLCTNWKSLGLLYSYQEKRSTAKLAHNSST